MQYREDHGRHEAKAETTPDITKDTKVSHSGKRRRLLEKVVCTGIVSSSSSSLKT
jgi:hypothetical protein